MEANLALPAALISDPVRAAILSALCDGRAQPAAALACAARVSPQCASNYLAPTAESIFPRRFSSKTAFYGAPFP